jgi:lipid II:glycine glycyltransferase (peptidoglycan interpeptide bridge formation enzyme)
LKKEINEIFTFLASRNIVGISIVGNPLFNCILPEQFREKVDFTQILKLDEDKEKLWATYSHGVRQYINKAKKFGVVCKVANNNINKWKKYYSIYQEALERWGNKATSQYPFSLFENMFKARDPNIKLWFVIFDAKVVGGCLTFYHNKHCVSWYAFFLSDYFKYGISNFLFHNIILDAIGKGYKYYDFSPSGWHKGTVEFKKNLAQKDW